MFLPIYLQQLINQLIFNIMKKLLLPVFALLALASCNNEEIQDIQSNEPVAISFGQSLGLYTSKAPIDGDKLTNNTIGIWAVEYTNTPVWGDGITTNNFMDNELLTVDEAGAITYTNTKYYSIVPNTKYDFYAYSPQATVDNGIAVTEKATATPTLNVTLKTTASEQLDILWATKKGIEKSTSTVNLGFKHALAQLIFKIQKEDNVKAERISQITVKANTIGTISLENGEVSGLTTGGGIFTAYQDATGQNITTTANTVGNPLLIFPETLKDNSITFTIDGMDYTFAPSAETILKANQITTITVTVKQTSLSFSQSVEPWGNNAGTGTIG